LEHIISCGVSGASAPLLCRVVGQHLFLAGENAWLDPFGVTAGRNPVGDRGTKSAHSGRPLVRCFIVGRSSGHFLSIGNDGLPEDSIQVNLSGTAGQSFGAFLAKGITFNLEGEGNDYVGKGLCGGKIIIKPPKTFNAKASENIIVGNTVMYGATSGKTFFSGIAGERFCVRNSGASAVVEGVGNHGCEYMTGGTVAVLGPTGQNFAAGMSGGVAYIFDVNKTFEANCNKSMVTLEKVLPANSQPSEAQHLNQPDEVILKTLVSDHLKYTNSEVAKHILDNWDDMLNHFVKVMPNEYRRALNELQEKTNKETV
jgi:glutamate synthase (NADPH/NADH) large chain